jgi:lipopolysaccharide export system protein LptA
MRYALTTRAIFVTLRLLLSTITFELNKVIGLTGENAVLDTASRTIVVTGSPVIHEGQSDIRPSKITIYLDRLPTDFSDFGAGLV